MRDPSEPSTGLTRERHDITSPHVGAAAPSGGRQSDRTKVSPETRSAKPLLAALAGERQKTPPVWLMRQAGRYLPEYRELRAKASTFLDFCYEPRLAVEATLQPIRRFGFDAAILFCDILVLPDALGQRVGFESGDGPRLDPIGDAEGLTKLKREPDWGRLAPVFEALERVKGALPKETALIGFCGAPWTVASYMIAGRGTPDQAPARLFAYRHPALFARLIDLLVDASAEYLCRQFAAGAEAAQIFDSWAGVLPPAEFERWCVAPVAAIAAKVRAKAPHARLIAFPRGAGDKLAKFGAVAEIDAIGLDTAADPPAAIAALPERFALQGNLDPLALIAGGRRLDEEIERVKSGFASRAHIFNLGHGVLPETPIEHVERLVARVRGEPRP